MGKEERERERETETGRQTDRENEQLGVLPHGPGSCLAGVEGRVLTRTQCCGPVSFRKLSCSIYVVLVLPPNYSLIKHGR